MYKKKTKNQNPKNNNKQTKPYKNKQTNPPHTKTNKQNPHTQKQTNKKTDVLPDIAKSYPFSQEKTHC